MPTTTSSASSSRTRAAMRSWSWRRERAALEHRQRRGDRARAVADRDTDPLRAEVEAEGPHDCLSLARDSLAHTSRGGGRRVAGDAERLVEAGRVAPAGRGDVALAAAAAADGLGGVLDEARRLDPGGRLRPRRRG